MKQDNVGEEWYPILFRLTVRALTAPTYKTRQQMSGVTLPSTGALLCFVPDITVIKSENHLSQERPVGWKGMQSDCVAHQPSEDSKHLPTQTLAPR